MSISHLPTLYKRRKDGKIQQWTIFYGCDCMLTESGIYGMTLTRRNMTVKTNSTGRSLEEQIAFEAKSKWDAKKKSDLMSEDINLVDSVEGARFMLAEEYHPDRVNWVGIEQGFVKPLIAQWKLDGVRAQAFVGGDSSVRLLSRENNEFMFLENIKKEVYWFVKIVTDMGFSVIAVDGELYNHSIGFNRTAGIVKSTVNRSHDEHLIKYYIFDIVIENVLQEQRLFIIHSIFQSYKFSYLERVLCYKVFTPDDVVTFHSRFTEEGYEGIMLRMQGTYYEYSRTYSIMKHKTFPTMEVPVVDATEAEGEDTGTVVWICQAPNGQLFNVRPKGKREERRAFYDQRDDYIGKMLTIKYQALSEYGVPRFPVALIFRRYEGDTLHLTS